MAVPAVFLNGKEFGQGRMTLSDIVTKVDVNAEKILSKTESAATL